MIIKMMKWTILWLFYNNLVIKIKMNPITKKIIKTKKLKNLYKHKHTNNKSPKSKLTNIMIKIKFEINNRYRNKIRQYKLFSMINRI